MQRVLRFQSQQIAGAVVFTHPGQKNLGRRKETRTTVKPGPSQPKSMKDEARERSTVNLRAEADGHESAILSPAQDAGLRVPAPLSALGVEVCAAEGDEGGLPPADPRGPHLVRV